MAPLDMLDGLFLGIAGLVGLVLAGWRCVTADRNLLRERWQMGMELLRRSPDHYAARVAGAAVLSDILCNTRSKRYDEAILRSFEAYLFSPSVFGGCFGKHQKNEVDYESRDTYVVVTALRRYKRKNGSLPLLPLPPGSVFTIKPDAVEPDTDHPGYKRWMAARGRPPEYSD